MEGNMSETKLSYSELCRKVDRIYTELVGDDELKHRGLIRRVETLEKFQWKALLWIAGIVGGGTVVLWLLDRIPLITQLFAQLHGR